MTAPAATFTFTFSPSAAICSLHTAATGFLNGAVQKIANTLADSILKEVTSLMGEQDEEEDQPAEHLLRAKQFLVEHVRRELLRTLSMCYETVDTAELRSALLVPARAALVKVVKSARQSANRGSQARQALANRLNGKLRDQAFSLQLLQDAKQGMQDSMRGKLAEAAWQMRLELLIDIGDVLPGYGRGGRKRGKQQVRCRSIQYLSRACQ